MPERCRRLPADERAISEVLSYALVFSIIVVSIGIVSVGGLGGLDDARTVEQIQNAEQAYDVLHDNMADLYYGGAPSRATEISLGDSELFFGSNVTVNVSVEDPGGDLHVTEYEIRPVVQRVGEERFLVYEAGAVFRTNRDSGVVVHEPPQVYRSGKGHATIPALQSATVQGASGSNVLLRAKVVDRETTVSKTGGGPFDVYVTVESPRYDLWEEFLVNQPLFDAASCTVDDAREVVECEGSSLSTVYVVVHRAELSVIR